MERPKGIIEAPQDEYDHELTQVQADFIACADVLLEHKDQGSDLSFVDIVVPLPAGDVYDHVRRTHLGSRLLASDDEQLAIESDGSYYPQLDVRKQGAAPTSVWIRTFGWSDKKYRFTDEKRREWVEYGETRDKLREIDISFSYKINGEYVSESIVLYGGTYRPGGVDVSSTISMPAYAETGYEGHGGKSTEEYSDADVYELLDLIASIVGDQPKSYGEAMDEQLQQLYDYADQRGVRESIEALVDASWPAQALYHMRLRLPELGGISIAKALKTGTDANDINRAVEHLLDGWSRRFEEKPIESDTSGDTDIE